MPRRSGLRALFWISAAVAATTLAETADAQTVWSGLTLSFSKAASTDPMLPENQDRITGNIWLTRGPREGLVNAASECSIDTGCTYVHNLSPAGTEWATDILDANVGKTIAATNWAQLEFTDWEAAYDNHVGGFIIARDAVVHLIADNIYLDIRFTDWSVGGGARFSYMRAVAPTPPTPTGDYNGDNVVDAADYVVWRANLGQPVAMNGDGADGNESGVIDDGDYDFWRMQFGAVAPPPGSGSVQFAAVPEPASSAGLLMGLFGTLSCSNRWARRFERYVS